MNYKYCICILFINKKKEKKISEQARHVENTVLDLKQYACCKTEVPQNEYEFEIKKKIRVTACVLFLNRFVYSKFGINIGDFCINLV